MSNWQNNLSSFFKETKKNDELEKKSEIETFISDVALPGFTEIAAELESHKRVVTIRSASSSIAIVISYDGEEELSYRIQGRMFPTGMLPYAEIRYRQRGGLKLVTVESLFRPGSQNYRTTDITKEEVIQHFIKNYTSHVKPA